MSRIKECLKCNEMVKREEVPVCTILEKPCEYVKTCPLEKKPDYDEIAVVGLFRSNRPDNI